MYPWPGGTITKVSNKGSPGHMNTHRKQNTTERNALSHPVCKMSQQHSILVLTARMIDIKHKLARCWNSGNIKQLVLFFL